MADMSKKTWCELEGMRDRGIIIPIGSVEQHGPHLPLETDSLLVERIAGEVAERIGCLVAPTLILGVSEEHMDFVGTITLSPETFKGVVYDVCNSLSRHGFSKLHIISYHGGNKQYLVELLPEIKDAGITATLHRVLGRLGKFDHAGEVETSLMLYLFPELVRKDRVERFHYRIPAGYGWRTKDYSESGVIGEAVEASPANGIKYFNQIVEAIVEEIEDE
ncbi:MAG: creatininase family protein [Candidatus Altiarchaeota archaeon]|nr:creatininase family protein [Candidatus Altiarchaeota archaeon]